jgi:hypothetical protein
MPEVDHGARGHNTMSNDPFTSRWPEVRSIDCTGWIEPGEVYISMQLTAFGASTGRRMASLRGRCYSAKSSSRSRSSSGRRRVAVSSKDPWASARQRTASRHASQDSLITG